MNPSREYIYRVDNHWKVQASNVREARKRLADWFDLPRDWSDQFPVELLGLPDRIKLNNVEIIR